MKNIEGIADGCYGCSACIEVCPTKAISMHKNKRGFLYPIVNNIKCVGCDRCMLVCPAINRWEKQKEEYEPDIYAFVNNDRGVLEQSTSGGFFTEAVKRYKADYVVGCIQDKDLYIRHKMIKNLDEIVTMQGSKYVQSDMMDSLSLVEQKLKEGYKVVFSGTSCQVHGLNKYLDVKRVEKSNLLTLDFICHGVPSPGIYRDYLIEYKKITRRKVISHKFRSKRFGWGVSKGAANYLQNIENDKSEDYRSYNANIWQNIFFSDLCLRDSCYSCPYASINKPSDITMGDFWGIEKYVDISNIQKGCSMIIARTEKARNLCRIINPIRIGRENYNSIINIQARLKGPVSIPLNREEFWNDYEEYGFRFVKKKYFMYNLKNRILIRVYFIALMHGLNKLSSKIERKIFI